MSRPQKKRKVQEPPKIQGMKPVGVPARYLDRVNLSLDEYEAVRLADYEGRDHRDAAEIMGISRPTFTRLIEKARKKMAESLVDVKELVIEGGNYSFATQLLRCRDCNALTRFDRTQNVVETCPACGSKNVIHLNRWFTGEGETVRGPVQGRTEGAIAAGPGGNCLCPDCGHRVPHLPGQPCSRSACPLCGALMTREPE